MENSPWVYPLYIFPFMLNDYTMIYLGKSSIRKELVIFLVALIRIPLSLVLAPEYNFINPEIMALAAGYFINENLYFMVIRKRNSVFIDLCFHSRIVLIALIDILFGLRKYTNLEHLGISLVFIGLMVPNMTKRLLSQNIFYIFLAMIGVVISTVCINMYDKIRCQDGFNVWNYKFTYDLYSLFLSSVSFLVFVCRNRDLKFGFDGRKDFFRCVILSIFSILKFYLFSKKGKFNRLIMPYILCFLTRVVNSFFVHQEISAYEWAGFCIATIGIGLINLQEALKTKKI